MFLFNSRDRVQGGTGNKIIPKASRIILSLLPTTMPVIIPVVCYALIFLKVRRSYMTLQKFNEKSSVRTRGETLIFQINHNFKEITFKEILEHRLLWMTFAHGFLNAEYFTGRIQFKVLTRLPLKFKGF